MCLRFAQRSLRADINRRGEWAHRELDKGDEGEWSALLLVTTAQYDPINVPRHGNDGGGEDHDDANRYAFVPFGSRSHACWIP